MYHAYIYTQFKYKLAKADPLVVVSIEYRAVDIIISL